MVGFKIFIHNVLTVLQPGKMLHPITPPVQLVFFVKRFSHRHQQRQVGILVEFNFKSAQTLTPILVIKSFVECINDKDWTSCTDISCISFRFFLQFLQIVFILEVEYFTDFSNNAVFVLAELNTKAQINIRLFDELRSYATYIMSLATSSRTVNAIGFILSACHIVNSITNLLPRQWLLFQSILYRFPIGIITSFMVLHITLHPNIIVQFGRFFINRGSKQLWICFS